jgi:phage terminase small subunit
MTHRKPTDRQALFVREYLVDLNATQAAIRAGYAPRSASQRGWALRRHPGVAARIEAAMADRAEAVGITAERVLCELARLGFANIQDFFRSGDNGAAWLDPAALTREQTAAITAIEMVEGAVGPGAAGQGARGARRLKVKLADKSRNLELIGRHLGIFPRLPAREKAKGEGEGVKGEGAHVDVRPLSDEDRAQEIFRLLAIERKGG